MKSIIIIAALLATTAYADDRYCTNHGKLSESIMRARQAGVTMSDMMEAAKENELFRAVIVSAFQKPRMSLPENKKTMIENFRADNELQCFEAHARKTKPAG